MPPKHRKKSRPLSKTDKLKRKQSSLIAQSHPDFLEERRDKRRQCLDDGFEAAASQSSDEEGVGKKLMNIAQMSANSGGRGKNTSKKQRGTAEQQADQLFRDIQGDDGAHWADEDEEEDEADQQEEDEEAPPDDERHEPAAGEEETDDDDYASVFDDDDDEDGDAPPDEFSSIPRQKNFGIEQERDEDNDDDLEIDDEQLHEVGLKRRKLSKKKRDAQKRVEQIADGKYRVEIGGAQFEVIALDRHGDGSSSTNGGIAYQCADGFPPLMPPPMVTGADPRSNSMMPVNFREQLLHISTAKKRSKRCFRDRRRQHL